MWKGKLLACGNNAKTVKGDGSEFLTAIMYLAPADTVSGVNLCPMAERAGCKAGCLYKAGRGVMTPVEAGRVRKTMWWRDDREGFLAQLRADIASFERYCAKRGIKPCVRLNGTSDIRWERTGIPQSFPAVQFYDYTKDAGRFRRPMPANYHLTLSYSEGSDWYRNATLSAMQLDVFVTEVGTGRAPRTLHAGKPNVAVVFRDKATRDRYMATGFLGREVIDGDRDDLRFLDPAGVVVGLYAKGPAKRDRSGFVVD